MLITTEASLYHPVSLIYVHCQSENITKSLTHDSLIVQGWLRSRTIVTIVELWLDWTTNSSTRLTSHIYYYNSSTHLFELVSMVSKWRWHVIEIENMFILDCEWLYLLILGHIHLWLCMKCKRVVLNRCKELCRLETPLNNLWIHSYTCFQP
jgi:hypothetical protein